MTEIEYDGEPTAEDRATIHEWHGRLQGLPHLFRYVSLRGERFAWFYDVVLRSLLYFPCYADLNDPFDGAVQLDYSGTEEEVRRRWEPMYVDPVKPPIDVAKAQRFIAGRDDPAVHKLLRAANDAEIATLGVACFSEVADDLPMWAYYGDAQRGLCLRFRTDALMGPIPGLGPLMPVTYADTYPRASFYRDRWFRRSQVTLLTKAKVWSHEQEWRILRRAGPGHTQMNPAALDGVVMGCRVSDEDEARVRDVVSRRTPQVELLRARPAEGAFKLTVGPA